MLDFTEWIKDAGAVGGLLIIGSIIFAESGLLIGFFLPGDTLLFTAGFFSAQGHFPLPMLILTVFLAAVIGDNVGYSIGRRTGPLLFRKKDGIIFRHDHVMRAQRFYEKHGGKTIILARFVPIVRTFAPVVAGVGAMTRQKFFMYNIVGAAIWSTSVTTLGYWLGSKIPNIDHYLLPVTGIVVLLIFAPAALHLVRDTKLVTFLKNQIKKYVSARPQQDVPPK